MYIVQFSYFDNKGDQHTKVIEKQTIKSLISAMKKVLDVNELYHITHVSPNLVGYNFKQHGDSFIGWNLNRKKAK